MTIRDKAARDKSELRKKRGFSERAPKGANPARHATDPSFREKELERTILDCEERFRNLIYFIPSVAIQGYDKNGVVLHWNRASEALFGYTAEEAIGKRLPDLILPPELHPIFPQCLEAGTKICSSGEYMPPGEMMLRRKDGSYVPTYTIHTAVCAEDRDPELFCIHMDLSERRRMEEERRKYDAKLQQFDKFQSLRALAAGVAHDFNNQIQGVLGYIELLLACSDATSTEHRYAQQAYAAAEKAAHVGREMLAYLGQGRSEQTILQLSQVVQSLVNRILSAIPEGARLDLHLGEGLPEISGDFYQIGEAIMNLVVNAVEALPQSGGVVTVETSCRLCSKEFLDRIRFDERLPEGQYVCVSIIDTGSGMPPEVLQRAFDPFYSTKFAGRGLGLAATLGIMQAHHGGVLLESRPGEGTTCRLFFPAVQPAS